MSDSIEVQCFDPTQPVSGMIAILQNASDATWTDMLGAVGSGSVKCSAFDAKAAQVQQGSLIKFCLGSPPVPVFAFFNTSPVLEIGEADTSVITLAGSSVLAYTGRARVDPPGGWAAPTASIRSGGETAMGGTFGGILLQLITEAKARGTIPNLTPQFTATTDSAGNAWAVNASALTISVGCLIQDVILQLVARGMGVYMDPQLNLFAYIAGAYGANLASTVVFQEGRHFTQPVNRNGAPIKGGKRLTSIGSGFSNAVLAMGTGNVYEEATDSTVSNPYIGRWESAIDLTSTTGDTTLLSATAAQQIVNTETASAAITVELIHDTNPGGYEPYVSCRPGDTIALNVPGQYAMTPAQIVAYTLTQIDGANYAWQANLGSSALPIGLRVALQAAQNSGTTATVSAGTVTGNLQLANPRGFPMGPTLPLNPSTGMWWLYTKAGVNEWYYYDGTRWLSTTLYLGASGSGDNVAFPFVTSATIARSWTHQGGQSMWVVDMPYSLYVTSTNTTNYYWTFKVSKYSPGGGSTALASVNSGARAANTWYSGSVAIGALVDPASYPLILVDAVIFGSPGALVGAAGFRYRRVAT